MSLTDPELATAIVRDAGGEIVGRTRLQKTAYLLEVTGLGSGVYFAYKHYGPYSEDLALSAARGVALGNLKEETQTADWGGIYSIYSVDGHKDNDVNPKRRDLATIAAKANPVALELAATAIFLSREGQKEPWIETKRRKPEKAAGRRLDQAKRLVSELKQIDLPKPLPDNV